MKTNNLYITLFAALAITACSKDNELPQGSAKDPNADMPDAYTSIAINIPHTTMTKAASGRAIDQGIADENKVKTLHVFIYDTDAPNTPTVAEFTVDDNTLTPKSPGSSTWVTNRAIKTKKPINIFCSSEPQYRYGQLYHSQWTRIIQLQSICPRNLATGRSDKWLCHVQHELSGKYPGCKLI